MNIKKIVITASLSLVGLAFSAQAQLVFTIEGPGVQQSSVPGVITETFDAFPTGGFSGATDVGTMSSGGTVFDADQYGGAFGTKFMRPTTGDITLTLPGEQNYFGLWWSAGDAANWLDFYDGVDFLGTYQVGSIIPLLGPPAANPYYGNPNDAVPRRNMGEPYAYLNFTTLGDTHITRVVFRGGNFEFDNLSITDDPIDPPGTLPGGGTPPTRGVPDGGATLGLLSIGLVGLTAFKRNLRK